MIYLNGVNPDGSFVAASYGNSLGRTRDELADKLRTGIREAEVAFFDLDGTLASAAKYLISKAVGTSRRNHEYIGWVAKTLVRAAGVRLYRGVEAQVVDLERRTDAYLGIFIDQISRSRVEEFFVEGGVPDRSIVDLLDLGCQNGLVYPGVSEFHEGYGELNPEGERVLITRNIPSAARYFGERLGFDQVFFYESDKARKVRRFSEERSEISKYLVFGDSGSDADMVNVLESMGKNVTSVQVMKRPRRKMNSAFDFAVSRNWKGLLELLDD